MQDNPFAHLIPGAQQAAGTRPGFIPGVAPLKTPSPQTPAQAQRDQIGVERDERSLEEADLDIEAKRRAPKKEQFEAETGLRKEFENLEPVRSYRAILPQYAAAVQADDNQAGDLQLVYAFGKIMDPGSVVREGELDMASSAGGVGERLQGYLASLQGGGRLTPQIRQQLLGEIRTRASQLADAYNLTRKDFAKRTQQYGFDPEQVLGSHPGGAFQQAEANFLGRPVRNLDGSQGAAPTGQQQQGPIQFGAPNGDPAFEGELKQLVLNGQINTPEEMVAYGLAKGWTVDKERAAEALKAFRGGQGFADPAYVPPKIDESRKDAVVDPLMRGVADTALLGFSEEAAAAVDTITKGGDYRQNLAQHNAVRDFDNEHNFGPRFTGQLAGGMALPTFGAAGVRGIAGVGAGYGAGYGLGSTDGNVGERARGAVMGAAAGGIAGAGLGAAGNYLGRLSARPQQQNALVDPATGALNQPLDAMTPAQRVGELRAHGINSVTPGMAGGRSARVIEQGLNNLPPSAGIMEDVNNAVTREARDAAAAVANRAGTARTLDEGGTELQRGAGQWIERAKGVRSDPSDRGVVGKAYDAVPINPKAKAADQKTVAALQDLTGRFQSNPDLAQELNNPKFAAYLDAVQKNGLSWEDMKAFRHMIGEKIGERLFGEGDSVSDLRRLYASLSEDMRATASAQGPKALRAFERANSLNAAVENRIEGALVRILGNDAKGNPQKAALAVQAMAQGGKSTGDLKTLAQVRASTIKSGAWDEIASTLIRLGGQPAKSEGRAFNPQTFVNWYADMAEPARAMLFKPELRKALDGFVAVSQQLALVKGLTNTSHTTPTMLGGQAVGIMSGGIGAAAVLNPLLTLKAAIVGGVAAGANYGIAKLWTNAKFVNLITGYAKAAASGNANAAKSQMGRIQKLGTMNPELREGVEALMRSVANDNANLGTAAASDPGQDEQKR